MATVIADYDSLKTAISEWFYGRDLSADADVFIDLAEAYFNAKLRLRQMETVDDLSPTDNVCALPADYVEYKRVVELASIRRRLQYISEDAADEMYPARESGLACHFMIVGDDLTALPLSSNDIELTYYAKIPALSESNTTNWLLTAHPNLYLHACLLYAAEFGKYADDLVTESTFVQNYVDLLHSADNRGKFARAGVILPGIAP